MTLIALIALALVASVSAVLLARGRARADSRAKSADTARGHAEERTRATEGRLARLEQQLREAQEDNRRTADRALGTEDNLRTVERQLNAARDETREAERHATAETTRADRAEQRLAAVESRLAESERQASALFAEIGHLAQERIAATAVRLSHASAPLVGPLDAEAIGPEAVRALQSVLDAATAALADERERVDAAARATMRGATSRIQTLLYQIQSLVQQLQHENDDPRLLELDFRNEVALRRIQTVAVLCEAWPGLARTDSPLAEVVVGALSRVPGYARIKVANHLREQRLAVVARAAEPIAVTLAELLANATAYSHPETDVPVSVQQGGRGALVIIDDSGIGMEEDQLRRARRLLAGPSDVLLTELGNPPKTGFAVVGKLARQYGFSCHVEPSPYGGTRAILRIPAALVTVVDEEQQLSVLTPLPLRAGNGPTPAPTVVGVPPMRDADERDFPDLDDRHHQPGPPPIRVVPDAAPTPEAAPDDDGSGLPSRRRRRPLTTGDNGAGAPVRAEQAEPSAELQPPVRSAERAAESWQALQRGTGAGRAAVAEREREARETAPEAAPGTAPEGATGTAREAAPGTAPEGATGTTSTTGDTTAGRDSGDTTTGQTLEGAEQ
ncbi:ATP-binding protein [Streptomyces sp. NRRL WC-3742]|uniref:ATP-binding protein n=1 Tax=Streptomyces sp. NRRL WC-3742 TaxID=1463934 RepID=UPI0007C48840|nr:ATP-binding protein [Streptomyces sp. NRRL WC-3742]